MVIDCGNVMECQVPILMYIPTAGAKSSFSDQAPKNRHTTRNNESNFLHAHVDRFDGAQSSPSDSNSVSSESQSLPSSPSAALSAVTSSSASPPSL